jgi:hypothetical protein
MLLGVKIDLGLWETDMSDWHNTSADRETALARARGYPYPLPSDSYTWNNGVVGAFDPAARSGRTPVLAVGSNQAPDQLTRKFGRDGNSPIPVQRCHVRDFDVVYAAHIARYGSVPAMLQASPGTEVSLFATWLNDEQLAIMNQTELDSAHYHFGLLEDVVVTLDDGSVMNELHAYIGRRGHLLREGAPVALSTITARDRRYTARDSTVMLSDLRAAFSDTPLAHEGDVDDFIMRMIEDQDYREACVDAVSVDAVAFGYPYKVIAG